MNLKDFRYSVAIRTLGKAGENYQKELDSLNAQSIKPEKIVVYLAEGYEKPKETIGWEQIVYVPKGMVAQRALPYSEIDSPYILMLDDDVYLPSKAVETLAKGLLEYEADCIAADTFHNHEMSKTSKIRSAITNWAIPIRSKRWAIKIQHTGSFCYNNQPTKDYYQAQSAAGPCSLWKKEAFNQIRFQDEIWLDKLGFAYGDDLLCFYKLHLNGGKLMLCYNSGATHLDSKSSRTDYNKDPLKLRKRARAWFLLWWRIDYDLFGTSFIHKTASLIEYLVKFLWLLIMNLLYSVVTLSFRPITSHILGNIDGYKFVHSKQYKDTPNFLIANENSACD